MNTIKLGHATFLQNERYSKLELLEWLLSLGKEAIELSFVRLNRFPPNFSKQELSLLSQFKYKSLHAPVVNIIDNKKAFLNFPNKELNWIIEEIQQLDHDLKLNTILFHPDIVNNIEWLAHVFGSKLAFENMDVSKNFGKTITDLESVFNKAPKAKFVCDLNHVYTVDPTMKFSDELHTAFGDRLCHYHISAYNNRHDVFYQNQSEITILHGIKNPKLPMIHEGGTTKKNKKHLVSEDVFVKNYFENKQQQQIL